MRYKKLIKTFIPLFALLIFIVFMIYMLNKKENFYDDNSLRVGNTCIADTKPRPWNCASGYIKTRVTLEDGSYGFRCLSPTTSRQFANCPSGFTANNNKCIKNKQSIPRPYADCPSPNVVSTDDPSKCSRKDPYESLDMIYSNCSSGYFIGDDPTQCQKNGKLSCAPPLKQFNGMCFNACPNSAPILKAYNPNDFTAGCYTKEGAYSNKTTDQINWYDPTLWLCK